MPINRLCTEVIQHYDGHIAQLLGDGLLVYFGYPQAHEDDAQRAVRAGLGILHALGALNQRLPQAKGIHLSLRMGIHTGLVVVGEMGGAGRQEQLALGDVPNLAARLQGLAESNTVVISDATSRLVQGYFACQDLGAQTLRGVAEPVQVYCVLQESGARGRLDVAVTGGLTPLVGREQEVGLLVERWEQVKAGQGQVVLLTGEAGIGKSRLVQMLKEHVADEPYIRWECRNAEYYQNTALFPLVDLFQRILRFEAQETPEEKFGTLEHALSQYRVPLEESVPLFAPLLSVPIPEHPYPPLNLSPQRQRQKTLETIVAILLELAEQQPVLFILEDLHWTDPSTLELLNLVIEQIPTTSILTVLTCRPHFHPAWHHRSYLTEMTVNRLSHAQVEQIVTGITGGKTFPAEVIQQIIAKTDGVPLFIACHYPKLFSLCAISTPSTKACKVFIPCHSVCHPGKPSLIRLRCPPRRPMARATSRTVWSLRPDLARSTSSSRGLRPDCAASASGCLRRRSRSSIRRRATTLMIAMAANSRSTLSSCSLSAPRPVLIAL